MQLTKYSPNIYIRIYPTLWDFALVGKTIMTSIFNIFNLNSKNLSETLNYLHTFSTFFTRKITKRVEHLYNNTLL